VIDMMPKKDEKYWKSLLNEKNRRNVRLGFLIISFGILYWAMVAERFSAEAFGKAVGYIIIFIIIYFIVYRKFLFYPLNKW